MAKPKTVRVRVGRYKFCLLGRCERWESLTDGYPLDDMEEMLLRALLRARSRIAYLEEAWCGKKRSK